MRQKNISAKWLKVLTVLLWIGLAAFGARESAFAVTLEVTAEDGDISKSLAEAAAEARDCATAENPYIIRIPAGDYTLSKLIHIYSNVTIEMDAETVITMTAPSGSNMFLLGTVSGTYQGQTGYNVSEACAGYGGFENITIRGGTLVGNSNSTSCLIRMAHATNVTFDGVTFSGGGGKHQVEVAAIDGFTVKNCTFTDFYGTSGNSRLTCEALQLDIPVSETNYPGAYQDGTPVKNVTITGCTFKNLSKGIGSHSLLIGAYFTNIRINSNVFSNITYTAINCLNYYDCEIKDNVMENCGTGIDFSYYLPSYLSAANSIYTTIFEGGTAYAGSIRHKAKTVISGNKMTITCRSNSIKCIGIGVYGYNLAAETEALRNEMEESQDEQEIATLEKKLSSLLTGCDKTNVTEQHYYISDVTVTNNEIVTAGYGIRLSDAKKCTITDNTIRGNDFSENDAHIKAGNTYDGIYLINKSSASELSGNSISDMNGGGIYLSDSTALAGICGNTITGVKRYGIYLYSGAKAKVGITGNTVKSTSEAEALIYLNTTAGTKHVISNNILRGYKTNAAIWVNSGKFTVSDNTISRVSDGVVLGDEASGYVYPNLCSSKAASRVRFTDKNYYMTDIVQSSGKASKKGKLDVKLPAIKNIGGYEVLISTSKTFKKDVKVYKPKKTATSFSVSGLTAKKKYYVRAYAYKIHNDVRIYKAE